MIETILAELRRADDQARDWYAWLTNQCGHGVAGMALLLIGSVLLAPGDALLLIPPAYYLVWERWWQAGKDRRDSLVDTAHVTAGATLITAPLESGAWGAAIVMAVWAAGLALGVAYRIATATWLSNVEE